MDLPIDWKLRVPAFGTTRDAQFFFVIAGQREAVNRFDIQHHQRLAAA